MYASSNGILGRINTSSHDSPLFATYKQYVTITLLNIIQHNESCYPSNSVDPGDEKYILTDQKILSSLNFLSKTHNTRYKTPSKFTNL